MRAFCLDGSVLEGQGGAGSMVLNVYFLMRKGLFSKLVASRIVSKQTRDVATVTLRFTKFNDDSEATSQKKK